MLCTFSFKYKLKQCLIFFCFKLAVTCGFDLYDTNTYTYTYACLQTTLNHADSMHCITYSLSHTFHISFHVQACTSFTSVAWTQVYFLNTFAINKHKTHMVHIVPLNSDLVGVYSPYNIC